MEINPKTVLLMVVVAFAVQYAVNNVAAIAKLVQPKANVER